MARPKKPTHLLNSHGYSKEQLKEMERLEEEMCGNDDIVGVVPKDLNDIAKIYYRYLIDNLRNSKIKISNLDRPLIETTADCLSRIYIARKAIDEQGMVIEKIDKNGNKQLVSNPYVKIHLDYMNKLTQLTSRLGLDPSSRSTLASVQINGGINNDEASEAQDELNALVKKLNS